MKKWVLLLLIASCILTGCGAAADENTVETITEFRWGASENDIRQWHPNGLEEGGIKSEFESSLIVAESTYNGYPCDVSYLLYHDKLTNVYYGFKERDAQKQVEQYKALKEIFVKKYGNPESEIANAGANRKYIATWDAEGINIMLALNNDFFLTYEDAVSRHLAEKKVEEVLQERKKEEERLKVEAEKSEHIRRLEEEEKEKARIKSHFPREFISEGVPYSESGMDQREGVVLETEKAMDVLSTFIWLYSTKNEVEAQKLREETIDTDFEFSSPAFDLSLVKFVEFWGNYVKDTDIEIWLMKVQNEVSGEEWTISMEKDFKGEYRILRLAYASGEEQN